jgi:hypothetical protein
MSDPSTPTPEVPPIPSTGPEIKQSKSAGKAGARDAKRLRNNANRDVEAPDMPDAEKEREIVKRLGSRGHGSHNARTIDRVLKYAEKGYSPSEIGRMRGMPRMETIYRWRGEDPDFDEVFRNRAKHYVDDQMRQQLPMISAWRKDSKKLRSMLRTAKRLPQVEGLKGFEQVQASDRMIQRTVDLITSAVLVEEKGVHRTLQIASRQLPQEWGEKAEGDSNVVVIDVGLGGPIKTMGLPGSSDGQNAKALVAGRWKALPSPQEAGGGAAANRKEG